MKFILLIIFSQILLISPTFSHGSSDDCSSECNDYYCPSELKKNKEKNQEK